MSIGERVRKARKEKGLTQIELAKATGIAQATLSGLEKGDFKSSGYVASLASVLGVSALWLETGKGPEKHGSSNDEKDLDGVMELLAMFKESTELGRKFILNAAKTAPKRGD